jgi:hypothetical protein
MPEPRRLRVARPEPCPVIGAGFFLRALRSAMPLYIVALMLLLGHGPPVDGRHV